jgi:murein L,D-transpeptidase YcbB/YkuD
MQTPSADLRALHPQHPQFEGVRQMLLKVRAGVSAPQAVEEEANVRLPDGPMLRLGAEHPDVALLRQRLNLPMPRGAETSDDIQVRDAVKAFQQDHGIDASGTLTSRTRSALNLNGRPKPAAPAGSEVQRLLVNMERWRWMPEDMGDFHVWDNVPEFTARVVKSGAVIHTAKIVVGKVENQTPLFSANMRYVVFHPEWGVPDSIKLKEIAPYLRPAFGADFFGFFGGGSDTRVLQRHNLKVSYNGRPVDANQINWGQVDIRRFTFIQPAGPSNVLGVVKFRFPNKHDVYMHDTPQRELFRQSTRAFSHGCMRVENPGRLAEILLDEDKGWTADKVGGLLAQGYNNEIELTKQIPVHVTYFTALVGEDGQIKYFGDIYGHDARMAAALAGKIVAPEVIADSEEMPTRQLPKAKRRPVNNDLW